LTALDKTRELCTIAAWSTTEIPSVLLILIRHALMLMVKQHPASNKHLSNLVKRRISRHFYSPGGSSNLQLHAEAGVDPKSLFLLWGSGALILHSVSFDATSVPVKCFKQSARMWRWQTNGPRYRRICSYR